MNYEVKKQLTSLGTYITKEKHTFIECHVYLSKRWPSHPFVGAFGVVHSEKHRMCHQMFFEKAEVKPGQAFPQKEKGGKKKHTDKNVGLVRRRSRA